jgi:hypothetical protein
MAQSSVPSTEKKKKKKKKTQQKKKSLSKKDPTSIQFKREKSNGE